MVKFVSANDPDFKTISAHMSFMAEEAPEKISENWERYRAIEGG